MSEKNKHKQPANNDYQSVSNIKLDGHSLAAACYKHILQITKTEEDIHGSKIYTNLQLLLRKLQDIDDNTNHHHDAYSSVDNASDGMIGVPNNGDGDDSSSSNLRTSDLTNFVKDLCGIETGSSNNNNTNSQQQPQNHGIHISRREVEQIIESSCASCTMCYSPSSSSNKHQLKCDPFQQSLLLRELQACLQHGSITLERTHDQQRQSKKLAVPVSTSNGEGAVYYSNKNGGTTSDLFVGMECGLDSSRAAFDDASDDSDANFDPECGGGLAEADDVPSSPQGIIRRQFQIYLTHDKVPAKDSKRRQNPSTNANSNTQYDDVFRVANSDAFTKDFIIQMLHLFLELRHNVFYLQSGTESEKPVGEEVEMLLLKRYQHHISPVLTVRAFASRLKLMEKSVVDARLEVLEYRVRLTTKRNATGKPPSPWMKQFEGRGKITTEFDGGVSMYTDLDAKLKEWLKAISDLVFTIVKFHRVLSPARKSIYNEFLSAPLDGIVVQVPEDYGIPFRGSRNCEDENENVEVYVTSNEQIEELWGIYERTMIELRNQNLAYQKKAAAFNSKLCFRAGLRNAFADLLSSKERIIETLYNYVRKLVQGSIEESAPSHHMQNGANFDDPRLFGYFDIGDGEQYGPSNVDVGSDKYLWGEKSPNMWINLNNFCQEIFCKQFSFAFDTMHDVSAQASNADGAMQLRAFISRIHSRLDTALESLLAEVKVLLNSKFEALDRAAADLFTKLNIVRSKWEKEKTDTMMSSSPLSYAQFILTNKWQVLMHFLVDVRCLGLVDQGMRKSTLCGGPPKRFHTLILMLLYGWFDEKYNEYRSRMAAQELLDGLEFEESNNGVQNKGARKKNSRKKKSKGKKKNCPAAEAKIDADDTLADNKSAAEASTDLTPSVQQLESVTEPILDEINTPRSVLKADNVDAENDPLTFIYKEEFDDASVKQDAIAADMSEVQNPLEDCEGGKGNDQVSPSSLESVEQNHVLSEERDEGGDPTLPSPVETAEPNKALPRKGDESNKDIRHKKVRKKKSKKIRSETEKKDDPSAEAKMNEDDALADNKSAAGVTIDSTPRVGQMETVKEPISDEIDRSRTISRAVDVDVDSERLSFVFNGVEAVIDDAGKCEFGGDSVKQEANTTNKPEIRNPLKHCEDDEGSGLISPPPLESVEPNECAPKCVHCGSLLPPHSKHLLEQSPNEVGFETETNHFFEEKVEGNLTYSFGDFETEFVLQTAESSPVEESVRVEDSVAANKARQDCADDGTAHNAKIDEAITKKAITKDTADKPAKECNNNTSSPQVADGRKGSQPSPKVADFEDEKKNDDVSTIADAADSSGLTEEMEAVNATLESKVVDKDDQSDGSSAKATEEHRKHVNPHGFDATAMEKYLQERFDHIFSQKFDRLPSGRRVTIVRL